MTRAHSPSEDTGADPVQQARTWLADRGAPPPTDAGTALGPAEGVRAQDPREPEADPEAVARTIVLRRLTAQARSRHELRQTLAQRAVPDEVAERVLDRFATAGLVDDAEFARQWVESRQSRRHLSRHYLRRELQRKGVDRDAIDSALAEVDPSDELEAARALVRKKSAGLSGVDATTRYRRLAGALGRRGFSSSTISTVLGELGGS